MFKHIAFGFGVGVLVGISITVTSFVVLACVSARRSKDAN